MHIKSVIVASAILTSACTATPPAPAAPTSIVSQYGGTETVENGIYVRTYPGGSGSVSTSSSLLDDNWSFNCKTDAMSDKRDCTVTTKTGGPFIDYGSSTSPETVCIMGHDFPGRAGMMRIDGNPPIATDDEGCVPASRIVSQMMKGKTLTTRRVTWPYDYTRDDTMPLAAFPKLIEVIKRVQANR